MHHPGSPRWLAEDGSTPLVVEAKFYAGLIANQSVRSGHTDLDREGHRANWREEWNAHRNEFPACEEYVGPTDH